MSISGVSIGDCGAAREVPGSDSIRMRYSSGEEKRQSKAVYYSEASTVSINKTRRGSTNRRGGIFLLVRMMHQHRSDRRAVGAKHRLQGNWILEYRKIRFPER